MRGHIPDQFPVCRKPLPFVSDKSLVHRELHIRHDEILLHHMVSECVHEKGLTTPVLPLDKAKCRPSLLDDGYVLQQRLDLTPSPDCNILKPYPWNDSAF